MASILVVDDEPGILRFVARALRDEHRIVTAPDGAAAVAALAQSRFDLILCDVRLGNDRGTEIYRMLAARDPDQMRRFVFMSGEITVDENNLYVLELPILEKPFTVADLHFIVERCLREWGPAIALEK